MRFLRKLVCAMVDVFTALKGVPYWPPRAAAKGVQRRLTGGKVPARRPDDDSIPAILSPGRSTTIRPGETDLEAMDRLMRGEDL